ncbi:unnamed protein product [Caenorhabditis sp. 36 PRJEB53466]|nr:unnamed protein product [Caenorhabditis sp. 36 PRJEB53466]
MAAKTPAFEEVDETRCIVYACSADENFNLFLPDAAKTLFFDDFDPFYKDHLMIAQLKQTLQQNANANAPKSVEKPLAETSIKDRLRALNNSANQWQQRAPRPHPPAPQRRSSSNALKDLPVLQKLQQSQHQKEALEKRDSSKTYDITSGLKKFFGSSASSSASRGPQNFDSNEIDLDAITANARPVLKTVCRPRAPNRKKASQMAAFDERIRLESVKINEDEFVGEEEEPEKLETQAQAIAALKSAKELLKSPTKKSSYPEVMLIQIRGSKHTDVRLVAPTMSSIHEHACFVVVHQKHLMKYEGAMANILEKTKAAQLCIEIQGKSDLNCAADAIVTVTESSKSTLSKLLFCSENGNPSMNSQLIMSSEPFEFIAAKLNLVLRVADDRSAQTYSRRERLSVEILQPSETLILDFGSEIYVWTGRYSSKVNAAYALEYAKQLMEKPVKNGKTILGDSEFGEEERRPEWTLFRKIHQGVLDTLFKAKFADWPENHEVLTTCRPRPLFSTKKSEMKTYEDVKVANQDEEVEELVRRMLAEPEMEPIMMLEDQEIDRRMHDVITEDKSLWILRGEILKSIEFTEQFDSTRCYVLRWKYRIQKSGVRRIRTGKEEERETGRSRIAFFYWLGEHTSPKQHGLCALRIKNIDRDNSPRIRVADGNEPALFLALFEGKFQVSRDLAEDKPLRVFVVIGANAEETSLREVVDLEVKLRSHASYIEMKNSIPNIVCGSNCSPEQVRFVLTHAENLLQKAGHSGKAAVEVEGDVEERKWIHSTGRKRAMRVWRIFENEAESTNHLSGHKDCAFTFSQQILTETILIDVGEALWLWSEDVITTFALKVANKYWENREGPAKVVYNGAEPEKFQALFSNWETVDVENRLEPRDVKELLAERCRTFSLHELKERTNLPAGMDMRRLESYLTDEDFRRVFGIERSEFYAQKAWKQNEARKKLSQLNFANSIFERLLTMWNETTVNDENGAGWAGGETSFVTDKKTDTKATSLGDRLPVPVTITDLNENFSAQDDKYIIGKFRFATVMTVGIVKDITEDGTSHSYNLQDPENADFEYRVTKYSSTDGSTFDPSTIVEGTRVRAIGKLKGFDGANIVMLFNIVPMPDDKEYTIFKLEAKVARLFFVKDMNDKLKNEYASSGFRGMLAPPKGRFGGQSNSQNSQASDTKERLYPSSNQAPLSMPKKVENVGEVLKDRILAVLKAIDDDQAREEGSPIAWIAEQVQENDMKLVRNTIADMIERGFIFSTFREECYSIL